MAAIRTNAELAVRQFLKTRAADSPLIAEDYMDDGTILHLKIDINAEDGSATCDFTGTSPESFSNLNAPESVTRSALIYSLRTLIGTDMPLNAGVLAPITLVIPPDSILSPSTDAAVCCGNTETSQRVVDVIFKAFEACAASQGCMNSKYHLGFFRMTTTDEAKAIHFDYKHHSYGETICGGSGAGATWVGQSATQINVRSSFCIALLVAC